MKLKEKTMAILMIAILMISTFAVVMPVSADFEYYHDFIQVDASSSYLELTVTDDGDQVTWTFDFPVEDFTGDGNLNVGLIIAVDGEGEGPAFQIHNNDGATTVSPHGTWMYGSWGPTISDGWFGWPSADLGVNVTDLAWVEASGDRKGQGTDGILTISIDRSVLGDEFHWAASPTVGSGFWKPAYDVTMQVPTAFGWSTPIVDMGVPNYVHTRIVQENFRDTEKVWGGTPDLVILPDGDGLTVEVARRQNKALFTAIIPECYNPETSYTTFTFDIEPDGLADFQVQWSGAGWVYSEVTGTTWDKDISGWLPVPSDFTARHYVGSRIFTLEMPIDVLGGFRSAYKLGVQACRSGGRQIFYSTDPGHLWYDSTYGDYAHSTYYVDMIAPPKPPKPRLWGCPTYYDGVSMASLCYTPHKLIVANLKTAPHDEGYYPLTVVILEDSDVIYNRTFYIRPNARSFALYLHESAFPDKYSVVVTCDTGTLPYIVASRSGIERSG